MKVIKNQKGVLFVINYMRKKNNYIFINKNKKFYIKQILNLNVNANNQYVVIVKNALVFVVVNV